MPTLIKIEDRIINLDSLAFVERKDDNGTEVVTLFYEKNKKWYQDIGTQVSKGTKADPIITPLNMSFRGADAKLIWRKLSEMAEVWGLPTEIDPDRGGSAWPKR